MTTYSKTSPWSATAMKENYLEILNIRPVSAETDDPTYVLQPVYMHRPDLLAYDLYGSAKLWWVFQQRNLDKIQDPIFDFVPGLEIYLPKKESLLKVLGL